MLKHRYSIGTGTGTPCRCVVLVRVRLVGTSNSAGCRCGYVLLVRQTVRMQVRVRLLGAWCWYGYVVLVRQMVRGVGVGTSCLCVVLVPVRLVDTVRHVNTCEGTDMSCWYVA